MCRPETASDHLQDLLVALELELNHKELMFGLAGCCTSLLYVTRRTGRFAAR
jgi:hypothetical protein